MSAFCCLFFLKNAINVSTCVFLFMYDLVLHWLYRIVYLEVWRRSSFAIRKLERVCEDSLLCKEFTVAI